MHLLTPSFPHPHPSVPHFIPHLPPSLASYLNSVTPSFPHSIPNSPPSLTHSIPLSPSFLPPSLIHSILHPRWLRRLIFLCVVNAISLLAMCSRWPEALAHASGDNWSWSIFVIIHYVFCVEIDTQKSRSCVDFNTIWGRGVTIIFRNYIRLYLNSQRENQ